jgi:hypothetical protein
MLANIAFVLLVMQCAMPTTKGGFMTEMQFTQALDDKIDKLEARIVAYRHNLNESGIWLFLAILGCWGISDCFGKSSAILATLIIFSYQYWAAHKEIGLFFCPRSRLWIQN